MGAYLEKPVTDKETDNGTLNLGKSEQLLFAVSQMQGWRKTMEDAHITSTNLETDFDCPKGTSLFAVFDGHGGQEVAKFCAKYFVQALFQLESFKEKDYKEALCECFDKMDEMLMEPRFAQELREMMAVDDTLNILRQSSNTPNALVGNGDADADLDADSNDGEEEHDSNFRVARSSLDVEFGLDEVVEDDVDNNEKDSSENGNAAKKSHTKFKLGVTGRAESMRLEVSPADIKKQATNLKKTTVKKSPHAMLDVLEGFDDKDKKVDKSLKNADKKGGLTKQEAFDMVWKLLGMNKKKTDEDPVDLDNAVDEIVVAPSTAEGADREVPRFVNRMDLKLPTHAGTTACVALIIENKIILANAGDSRSVLCRKKMAHPLSFDHKPFNPIERSRVENAGGWVTPMGRICGNLNLSRCIGDLKYKQCTQLDWTKQIITSAPDINIVDITDDDLFFVICCDGIYDVMSNEDIISFVAKHLVTNSKTITDPVENMRATVEQVFNHCICDDPAADGKGADNMTATIICLKPFEEIIAAFSN